MSSGPEAKLLRQHLDQRLLVVIHPGIRPVENRPVDDQKRVVSVEEAFAMGPDYTWSDGRFVMPPIPRPRRSDPATIARMFPGLDEGAL